VAALRKRGINHLFPIQAQSFDALLAGRDMIARARTGSGKTLAFALPIIERLRAGGGGGGARRAPRVLVLAPTRELAKQVAEDFSLMAPSLTTLAVYGGVGMDPQRAVLWRGCDVVVGTPGRVIDLMEGGALKLDAVAHVVLDEADRMLDMGFADDVAKILGNTPGMGKVTLGSGGGGGGGAAAAAAAPAAAPKKTAQFILFSATLPGWVSNIARGHMERPVTLDLVEGKDSSPDVRHLVLMCPWQLRPSTIGDLVRVYGGAAGRTIVFVETKKEADELALDPALTSKVRCKAMHGDVPQAAREACLAEFKKGGVRCIVATDVAARGLDIKGVDLVIQTQPPCGRMSGKPDADTYTHRSGRTGRAGAKGTSILLFTRPQEALVGALERATKKTFQRIGAPQPADLVAAAAGEAQGVMAAIAAPTTALFLPAAEAALKDAKARGEGAAHLLARAFAALGGYSAGVKNRSLLSSSEGMSTWAWAGEGGVSRAFATLRAEVPALRSEDVQCVCPRILPPPPFPMHAQPRSRNSKKSPAPHALPPPLPQWHAALCQRQRRGV
jgi:ATP-dependent RNA helicase DDX21